MSVSISCDMLMRSLMARSMRTRPMRYWFSISSPTARTRRLPRWSMSSIDAAAVLELDEVADGLEDVALGEDCVSSSGSSSP